MNILTKDLGYIYTNQENRKFVTMYKYVSGKKINKLTSYAKYIVETNSQKFVPEGYEVDHINNDKTDDRLENLQIIPKWLNILKQIYDNNDFVLYKIKCPICGKVVDKSIVEITNAFCGRKNTNYLPRSKYVTCGNKRCSGLASTILPRLYLGDPFRYDSDGFDVYNNILGKTLDFYKIIEIENVLDMNNVKYIKRFR